MVLVDSHTFLYSAAVPWPHQSNTLESWAQGVDLIESWLETNIGRHYQRWAWSDSQASRKIGVAFRYDQDCCLFLLTWDR